MCVCARAAVSRSSAPHEQQRQAALPLHHHYHCGCCAPWLCSVPQSTTISPLRSRHFPPQHVRSPPETLRYNSILPKPNPPKTHPFPLPTLLHCCSTPRGPHHHPAQKPARVEQLHRLSQANQQQPPSLGPCSAAPGPRESRDGNTSDPATRHLTPNRRSPSLLSPARCDSGLSTFPPRCCVRKVSCPTAAQAPRLGGLVRASSRA